MISWDNSFVSKFINDTFGGLLPDMLDDEVPFCDEECDECCACDELEYTEEQEYDEPLFWGIPDIRRIIFNPPATIVFWDDNTKTVVKCIEGQPYERYAGFCAACMKKLFGSTSRAKAVMEECDEANWYKSKEKEPDKKESKPGSKQISMKEFIDAIGSAIASIIVSKPPQKTDNEKESSDETPAV